MKTRVIKAIIYISKGIMAAVYAALKLMPAQKGKVVFCSRQSSDVPLDFRLLQKRLDAAGVKYVSVCCRMSRGAGGYLSFAGATLRSMYHLATSQVCVLDSYWPAVSILRHKRRLTVIQIWHALGKIKKSGYQTLDKRSGRSRESAELLGMHRNYDYVIAGGVFWNRYYCESFGITEDKLRNYGLPRIDYLLETAQSNRDRFFAKYPQIKGKKIILYTPTFRRNMRSGWAGILNEIRDDGYVLIVKLHPNERGAKNISREGVYYMDEFRTIDLIAVCDYFITDYSAAALEAAVLSRKTYYWTYDYDEYMANNGLNFELKKEVGKYVFDDIADLIRSIKSEEYDEDFIREYREKYLPQDLGHSTEKITALILDNIKEAGIR